MNKPFLFRSGPIHVGGLFFVALALGATGCGENIFDIKWTEARVDTVLIYSLARPELNLPSGFDFLSRRGVELHRPGATGVWDLALDTQDGQMVFLPPGALDIVSDAMILPLPGEAFDDVIEAPKDSTLYTRDRAVTVETGTVYVLRTHRGANRFGIPCSFYGKLQPLDVDPVLGTVRFMYDVSRLCDDRGLIPND
ncbi:MAG: hypothetical protein IIB37_01110 [Gemmatimonadetes bacterium]|nr:hypothetical protein [Gemmatimonadota bacterium]MCH8812260.1 hypothetical protein [Gemmatimonadota bacterium]